MIQLSLIEQIKILISIIKNSKEIKYILPIIIGLGLVLIISCIINKKLIKALYIILYTIVISTLIYLYHEPLLKLVDYLIENIVNNLLFPNLAVYIFILLIVNIIIITTLLSSKIKLYIKNINITFFLLMQFLLFFIVNIIINNNINVYEKLTIYSNQNLLVLIEISMGIFLVWMLLLSIIKIINILIKKVENNIQIKETINNEITYVETFEEYNQNQVVIDYQEPDEFIEYVPIKKKEFRVSK